MLGSFSEAKIKPFEESFSFEVKKVRILGEIPLLLDVFPNEASSKVIRIFHFKIVKSELNCNTLWSISEICRKHYLTEEISGLVCLITSIVTFLDCKNKK